jgi:hypothetical protein
MDGPSPMDDKIPKVFPSPMDGPSPMDDKIPKVFPSPMDQMPLHQIKKERRMGKIFRPLVAVFLNMDNMVAQFVDDNHTL